MILVRQPYNKPENLNPASIIFNFVTFKTRRPKFKSSGSLFWEPESESKILRTSIISFNRIIKTHSEIKWAPAAMKLSQTGYHPIFLQGPADSKRVNQNSEMQFTKLYQWAVIKVEDGMNQNKLRSSLSETALIIFWVHTLLLMTLKSILKLYVQSKRSTVADHTKKLLKLQWSIPLNKLYSITRISCGVFIIR